MIRWSVSTMTSYNRRHNDHSMFTSKTPHFFKIILEETIRDGKIGIPRKFVRKYGKQLPSSIKLEVPSGAIWQVELTKSDGMVWIQKGWKEFAEHYSVKFGHFLVFRYEGNAHFHVLIFDKSASEIEYPYTSTEDDDDDDDLSVEICEEVSATRKNKEKSHLPCLRPHRKMRVDSPKQPGSNLNSEIADDRIKLGNLDGVLSPATKEVGGITDTRSLNTEVFSCLRNLTATEKAHVDHTLERFSAFKTIENPVFMVLIKPSAVRNKYQMSIPSNFARIFITMLKGILTLCDSNGKTWSVMFCRRSEKNLPHACVYGGWRAFAEDNNLDVGDICFFELIKHPEIVLKVFIYPGVENANRPPASRVRIRSLGSDSEATCRHSRCPSCSKEFKEPKIKGNENVDSDIEILDEFPQNQKTKKELPSPCFQPCKMVRTNPRGSRDIRYLSKELGGQFKYSANDDSRGMSGARRCLKPEPMGKMKPLTLAEKERARMRAGAFKSPNPSFSLLMQPSYVRTSGEPNIPLHFARRFFKKNGEVTLRGSDGRTWSVDYKINSRGKFCSTSWRAFVLDNNLKVGDTCVFELIKEYGRFLEVHFLSC